MDKELREKIAKEVELSRPSCGLRKECNTECGTCGADRILTLIKEAGWKSPEEYEVKVIESEARHELIRRLTAKCEELKKASCVKLAEDQTLPDIPSFAYDKEDDRKLLQRGAINYSKMLARWRKIELPE